MPALATLTQRDIELLALAANLAPTAVQDVLPGGDAVAIVLRFALPALIATSTLQLEFSRTTIYALGRNAMGQNSGIKMLHGSGSKPWWRM